MKSNDIETVENILKKGGVGVFPTDTLYGVVGSALNKKAVERIYEIRKREKNKPLIVLIASFSDLKLFDINPSVFQEKVLEKYWPGKVSVVLECRKKKWEYLHRGTGSIAFRFPESKFILDLLKKVGPLVAPSANIAGEKPAESFAEARKYFGGSVDFYVDCGKLKSKPSTLVKLRKDGNFEILRKGIVRI